MKIDNIDKYLIFLFIFVIVTIPVIVYFKTQPVEKLVLINSEWECTKEDTNYKPILNIVTKVPFVTYIKNNECVQYERIEK